MMLPKYTSSMSSGEIFAADSAPFVAMIPSYGPVKLESPPIKVPIGVLFPATIKTFLFEENSRLLLFTMLIFYKFIYSI